jgi:hypothetical protein
MLRSLLPTTALLAAALAVGCTGEIVETETTDFGVAVATSERTDNGDILTRLTTPNQERLLGALDWDARSGELVGEVAAQSISVDGTMQMDAMPIQEMNLLLFNLWELEQADPEAAHCVGNDAVLCCRDGSWSCRARYAE